MNDDTTRDAEDAGSDAYAVGPGKPPREHQFKKGRSGNPGGRPKGTSVTAELRRLLDEAHNGKAIATLLAERMVRDALAGKAGAAKELLDRAEGKVTERVEVQGGGAYVVLNVPAPKVIGESEEDYAARMKQQAKLAAEHAPPGSKVIAGDWPLRV